MIVLIDNYDSFTYNLVQYIGEFDKEIKVFRNDKIDPQGVVNLKPDAVVISPGPCTLMLVTPVKSLLNSQGKFPS